MKTTRVSTRLLIGATLALATANVDAQPHHGGAGNHGRRGANYHGPTYRIDSRSNVVRDRHGATIGRYGRNVIHRDSTYIVPHTGGQHRGTYYVREGRHYYHPQTASATGGHHPAGRPQLVAYGGFSQVDDLSGRLETLLNEFCLDLHYNYSHNPGFQQAYREAYQVLDAAKHIHAAKHHGDHAAVQQRLANVDQLFHHVQSEVQGWASDHHQQVGSLGTLSKMDLIESTLHHLLNDVGVGPAPADRRQAPPPAP